MATLIKRSLEQHEEIIESGVKSFIDVGRSLMAIRDEKLYPQEFKTFEAYCSKRWGFAKSHAYRLIESSVVVRDLSPNGGQNGTVPDNERQARALAEAAPDAKTREVVWKAAVASAPKDATGKPKVTAAVVKKAAAAVTGKNGKAPSNGRHRPLPIPTRQPGEDQLEPEHAPPAKFDDKQIEDAFGKLIRLVDVRAETLGGKGGAYHKTCLNRLGDFLKAFKEWKGARR